MRETVRMKMPVLALALLLLSCGDGEGEGAQAPRGDIIECATGGSERFERNCTMDYREDDDGLTVTVRNPEGGFRRLLLPRDGSGARAADGAEPATVTLTEDGRAEVAIAGDRYRLPATIGPRAAPKAQ
jgi:hypothetical protein